MVESSNAFDRNILMIDFIKNYSNDRNAQTLQGKYKVRAFVNNELIIDEELIECIFTMQLDSVDISIYWEEAGYKKYKNLGLYGKMNTKWQDVKEVNGELHIFGNSYKIEIIL